MQSKIQSQVVDAVDVTPELSRFQVNSKTEVVFILQSIMHKNEMVSAYFNHGNAFILTSILQVDKSHNVIILDYGKNEELNRKLLESMRIVFVTTHDKVKVQFSANQITKMRFQDHDAFSIKLPDTLLKLQRREYYRLITPIINPVRCIVLEPDGHRIDTSIADISLGGVGLANWPTELSPEIGAIYQGCKISLPEIGTVTATIRVMSVLDITLRSGAKSKRYGCQFVDMPASMQALIQRYIIKQERELRAKLGES